MVGGDHSFFVRFLPLGKDGVAPRKKMQALASFFACGQPCDARVHAAGGTMQRNV